MRAAVDDAVSQDDKGMGTRSKHSSHFAEKGFLIRKPSIRRRAPAHTTTDLQGLEGGRFFLEPRTAPRLVGCIIQDARIRRGRDDHIDGFRIAGKRTRIRLNQARFGGASGNHAMQGTQPSSQRLRPTPEKTRGRPPADAFVDPLQTGIRSLKGNLHEQGRKDHPRHFPKRFILYRTNAIGEPLQFVQDMGQVPGSVAESGGRERARTARPRILEGGLGDASGTLKEGPATAAVPQTASSPGDPQGDWIDITTEGLAPERHGLHEGGSAAGERIENAPGRTFEAAEDAANQERMKTGGIGVKTMSQIVPGTLVQIMENLLEHSGVLGIAVGDDG